MERNQVIRVFGEDAPSLDQRVESYGILSEHAVKIARHCYRKQYMLVLRAPKASSVQYRRENPCGWNEKIAAKPVFVKEKTRGGLTKDGFYSDYDILSYWAYTGSGYQRLETGSAVPHKPGVKVTPVNVGAETGKYLTDAPIALFELAIATGISEFQHGANDEFIDGTGKAKNQLANEKFVVFDKDGLIYLVPDTGAMKRFYSDRSLQWIYK